ncbi:hypothetical protein K470DRAFT_272348 [Piedraia hortae CBS 480.64]|uniref:Uncharacterized protein n=1 Tax=Piedraia hortae CBS 480.64 TaxID=1314780 RepID=A0A6A7BT47_9PEZI|nr:hypothetical protein K470DRAFT_272348 [Piedraia hortae CBS 480.64]
MSSLLPGSRNERLLMRQRGAGARRIVAQFEFDLGLGGSPAGGCQEVKDAPEGRAAGQSNGDEEGVKAVEDAKFSGEDAKVIDEHVKGTARKREVKSKAGKEVTAAKPKPRATGASSRKRKTKTMPDIDQIDPGDEGKPPRGRALTAKTPNAVVEASEFADEVVVEEEIRRPGKRSVRAKGGDGKELPAANTAKRKENTPTGNRAKRTATEDIEHISPAPKRRTKAAKAAQPVSDAARGKPKNVAARKRVHREIDVLDDAEHDSEDIIQEESRRPTRQPDTDDAGTAQKSSKPAHRPPLGQANANKSPKKRSKRVSEMDLDELLDNVALLK